MAGGSASGRLACPACGERAPITRIGPNTVRCDRCERAHQWVDGILVVGRSARKAQVSEAVSESLFEAEDRHIWFARRAGEVLREIRRWANGAVASHGALDIGCGTGRVMSELERAGMTVTGVDTDLTVLRLARRRTRGLLIRGAIEQLGLDGFDVVLVCDVLEHVSDDLAVVRRAVAALRPGGLLIATVPADMRLWSKLDDISGHLRRYGRGELQRLLRAGGLVDIEARYFNVLLWPLQLVRARMLDSSARTEMTDTSREELARRALAAPPAPVAALFSVLGLADRLPPLGALFGPSLIAAARRP